MAASAGSKYREVSKAIEMYQFSSDGKYFIQGTIDNELQLFNTASNKLEQTFSPTISQRHDAFGTFCSLSYVSADNMKAESTSAYGRVAVGTTTGSVVLFELDINTSTLVASNVHRSQRISDIVIDSRGDCIFTSSAMDPSVNKLSIKKKEVIAEYDAEKSGHHSGAGVTKIALSLNDKQRYLLAAGDDIRLFNADTAILLASVTGHAGSVSCLDFLSVSSTQVTFLSTSADQFMNIWQVDPKASTTDGSEPSLSAANRSKGPAMILNCVNEPLRVSCMSIPTKDKTLDSKKKNHLNGSLESSSKKSKKRKLVNGNSSHQKPAASVRARLMVCDRRQLCYGFDLDLSELEGASSSKVLQKQPSFQVDTKKARDCLIRKNRKLVIAYEMDSHSTTKLTERFVYAALRTKPFGKQRKPIKLPSKLLSHSSQPASQQPSTATTLSTPTKRKAGEHEFQLQNLELEVIPDVKVVQPEEHQPQMFRGKRRRMEESSLAVDQDMKQQSMKMMALAEQSLAASETRSGATISQLQPYQVNTGLVTLLKQGLTSNEQRVTDLCFEQQNSDLIQSTLRQLASEDDPEALVYRRQLVCLLVKTYLAKPSKSAEVLQWLTLALRVFGRKLSADAAIVEQLSQLYSSMSIRLRTKDKLIRLGGKVNFIISQIEEVENISFKQHSKHIKGGGDLEEETKTALVVYEED